MVPKQSWKDDNDAAERIRPVDLVKFRTPTLHVADDKSDFISRREEKI